MNDRLLGKVETEVGLWAISIQLSAVLQKAEGRKL